MQEPAGLREELFGALGIRLLLIGGRARDEIVATFGRDHLGCDAARGALERFDLARGHARERRAVCEQTVGST